MNVFEHLGLLANHREEGKVIQLVKHYDEVPDSKKLFPMTGQIKKDGVCAVVAVNIYLQVKLFSRVGNKYKNVGHLETALSGRLEAGIYIAELCCPVCSLEELSGIVNPNRNKPLTAEAAYCCERMELHFHDYIGLNDFYDGFSHVSYQRRYQMLCYRLPSHTSGIRLIECHSLTCETGLQSFFDWAVAKGEEGICIKHDIGWEAGHKGYRSMKLVRGVSYDLLCTGFEEGKGKYKGKVANLFFKWKDGKEIKAMLGKGWTHETAAEMFRQAHLMNGELYPIGKTFSVTALQESSKGKLRLPKVGELRHDKVTPDV